MAGPSGHAGLIPAYFLPSPPSLVLTQWLTLTAGLNSLGRRAGLGLLGRHSSPAPPRSGARLATRRFRWRCRVGVGGGQPAAATPGTLAGRSAVMGHGGLVWSAEAWLANANARSADRPETRWPVCWRARDVVAVGRRTAGGVGADGVDAAPGPLTWWEPAVDAPLRIRRATGWRLAVPLVAVAAASGRWKRTRCCRRSRCGWASS